MTLRILLYSHAWAPSVGGVEVVTRTLASGLSTWSKNHPGEVVDVTLVTQTPAGGMNDGDLPFRVVRRPSKTGLIGLLRSADLVHLANPAFVPLSLAWLLGKIVVIEHSGYQSACPNGLLFFERDGTVCPGHFLAKRYGKCIQCNSAGDGWLKSFRALLLTFPRRWLASRAAVNIVPTNHVGHRIALPHTLLIPHGVPNYSQTDGSSESMDNIRQDSPYFAYVGRLVREKGVDVLLRACQVLAAEGYAFRLKVIGDGAERSKLEKIVRDLNLTSRVNFLGSIPVENTSGLLDGAVAIIMPSIWEEVAGIVAYENFLRGNLVIASDIGGLGEIVDGLGFKFPAGDADALATCMRKALENPDLVRDLRSKAQRYASEKFTEEEMVANHLDVYRKIVESNAP
jgi:glycosyltransferase involved in cell wall biosynthesis